MGGSNTAGRSAGRSRRHLSFVEIVTLLAGLVAVTLSGRYFGLVLGSILGVVLFLAIVSIPIVLAIRRQRVEDRANGRLPGPR